VADQLLDTTAQAHAPHIIVTDVQHPLKIGVVGQFLFDGPHERSLHLSHGGFYFLWRHVIIGHPRWTLSHRSEIDYDDDNDDSKLFVSLTWICGWVLSFGNHVGANKTGRRSAMEILEAEQVGSRAVHQLVQ
jgi:hypothetical protein